MRSTRRLKCALTVWWLVPATCVGIASWGRTRRWSHAHTTIRCSNSAASRVKPRSLAAPADETGDAVCDYRSAEASGTPRKTSVSSRACLWAPPAPLRMQHDGRAGGRARDPIPAALQRTMLREARQEYRLAQGRAAPRVTAASVWRQTPAHVIATAVGRSSTGATRPARRYGYGRCRPPAFRSPYGASPSRGACASHRPAASAPRRTGRRR